MIIARAGEYAQPSLQGSASRTGVLFSRPRPSDSFVGCSNGNFEMHERRSYDAGAAMWLRSESRQVWSAAMSWPRGTVST